MISTRAPEADQIGIGAPQRPKSSLYGWDGNGEGVSRPKSSLYGWDGNGEGLNIHLAFLKLAACLICFSALGW